MSKIMISSLEAGNEISGFLLLTSVDEKTTKIGNAYCVFSLSDGIMQIEANLWNTSKSNLIVSEQSVIAVKLKCSTYNDNLSYEVLKYYPLTEEEAATIDIGEYIMKAPYSPEQMYDEILRLCFTTVGDDETSLPYLVKEVYEKNKEKIMYWSAAKRIHHNYYGGLLYHTFRMLRTASVLVKVYPSLNAELLFSAIALHDIGKLQELDTNSLGVAEYSLKGIMIGHIGIGIEEIRNISKDLHINEEKLLCLMHCIASHHGKQEWGALVPPAMKEAKMCFLIDMIDSSIEQYEKAEEILEPGAISDNIFGLNGRVYKHIF